MYHIIFSAKWHKNVFRDMRFAQDIEMFIYSLAEKYDFNIIIVNIDIFKPTHIHFLIRSNPKISISSIVRTLKQEITVYAFKKYPKYLSEFYWCRRHQLFHRGYFCSTVGDISEKNAYKYIKEQSSRYFG